MEVGPSLACLRQQLGPPKLKRDLGFSSHGELNGAELFWTHGVSSALFAHCSSGTLGNGWFIFFVLDFSQPHAMMVVVVFRRSSCAASEVLEKAASSAGLVTSADVSYFTFSRAQSMGIC